MKNIRTIKTTTASMLKKNFAFSWKKLSLLMFVLFNSNNNAFADTNTNNVYNFAYAENFATPLYLKKEPNFYIQYNLNHKASPIGIAYPNKFSNDSRENEVSFLLADSINGKVDYQTTATGNVEWRKSDFRLYADKLDYFPLDDKIFAKDNVRAMQYGIQLDTPDFEMEIETKKGIAKSADYQFVREVQTKFYKNQDIIVSTENFDGESVNTNTAMLVNVPHSYGLPTMQPGESRLSYSGGHAEELSFIGREFMKLKQATYSTCKINSDSRGKIATPDWYLQSPEIDLDFTENEGIAKNSTLLFKDVPIFYAPYFVFPVSKQRKSGFLAPTYKSSTKTGFDFSLPYYFNIAPNYDLTLYPRWMSKRGFQIGADARYLFRNNNGYLRGEYMPNDNESIHKTRYAYQFRHWQVLSAEHRIFANIDYNRVSDGLYWQDLSSKLLDTTQIHLPQIVNVDWQPLDWMTVNLQNVRYQTLQTDVSNPVMSPYFIQPQINISGYKANIFSLPISDLTANNNFNSINQQNSTRSSKYFLDFDFSFVGQFSRFTHSQLPSANRYVFYPQISMPFVTPGFQIMPKIGWHLTHYDLQNNYENFLEANALSKNKTNYSRSLPIFSIDSSMTFERNIKVPNFWQLKDDEKEYRQTLEPRLYYVYIPYRKQSHLPTLDTGLNDFNFGQMFSENRYSGYDRINDANQLTMALTTRLLGKNDGVEYFKAMVGQRYYFQPQKIALANYEKKAKNFSHIVASMTGLVYNKTYADTSIEYNHKDRSTERFSLGIRFQPDYGKVFSASYRYIKNSENLNSYYVLTNNVSNVGRTEQIDLSGQWNLGDLFNSQDPKMKRWYGVFRYNYSLKDKRMIEGIAGLEYNADCWAIRLVTQKLQTQKNLAANTSIFFQLELTDFATIGSNPMSILRRSVPGYGKTNELVGSY